MKENLCFSKNGSNPNLNHKFHLYFVVMGLEICAINSTSNIQPFFRSLCFLLLHSLQLREGMYDKYTDEIPEHAHMDRQSDDVLFLLSLITYSSCTLPCVLHENAFRSKCQHGTRFHGQVYHPGIPIRMSHHWHDDDACTYHRTVS